ncbi:MAG: tetratricopeptide repeat protein [Nitrospirota bacterium]
MIKQILHKPVLHIVFLTALCIISYSNTFSVPFTFDDGPAIIENPIVRDLQYFIEPSTAKKFKGHFEYETFKSRYVAYLTFALNYKFHGLDVKGYHVVSLLIHIINSLIVYYFLFLTFKTRFIRESQVADYAGHISFFTALLFACHPIQTQAVTYVWQRVTSLTAMFYLLSLASYVKAGVMRQKTELQGQGAGTGAGKPVSYYMAAVIFAALAMKTKEIAITLPVIIGLYELMFFEGRMKKRVLYLVPVFLTMLIIPLSLVGMDRPLGDMIGDVSQVAKEVTYISRADYLFTEFRVLVTYIRLIFLPVNQNLDYDYPVYTSFFNPGVFLSFLFLLAIFSLASYLFYRQRNTVPHIRLLSFGIFWLFITLSVESSVIPIRDVINEHRMYLPSIGIFISVVTFIFSGAAKIKERWNMTGVTIVLILFIISALLSLSTYARNGVWTNGVSLWGDVVSKSPGKARAHNNLCYAYKEQDLLDKALEHCRISIELDPYYLTNRLNIANVYRAKGLNDNAIKHYMDAIKYKPDYLDAHQELAMTYAIKGLFDKSLEHYDRVILIDPLDKHAYINRGIIYAELGNYKKAIENYDKAIAISPDDAKAYYNRGVDYMILGNYKRAIEDLNRAVKLDPEYIKAYIYRSDIYEMTGNYQMAVRDLSSVIRLNPEAAGEYFKRGKIHLKLGNYLQADNDIKTSAQMGYEDAKEYLKIKDAGR